jgi:hypothetical protein
MGKVILFTQLTWKLHLPFFFLAHTNIVIKLVVIMIVLFLVIVVIIATLAVIISTFPPIPSGLLVILRVRRLHEMYC